MTGRSEGKKALDAIVAAMDGVTDGPWRHTTYMSGTQNVEYPGEAGVCTVNDVADRYAQSVVYETTAQPCGFLNVAHRPRDKGHDFDNERHANGKYIAACSPDKIRSILKYVSELENKSTNEQ